MKKYSRMCWRMNQALTPRRSGPRFAVLKSICKEINFLPCPILKPALRDSFCDPILKNAQWF